MSSEESFNAAVELHCRRLISLWGKSDASRRALEEQRGPGLISPAEPPTTRNTKSNHYAVQEDSECKNSIPSAMRFHDKTKKRNCMGNPKATTCAKQQQPEQQYHHNMFDGPRNRITSSKRLTDEQNYKTRLFAADATVVTASSAPAVAPAVSLPDTLDLDSCFTDESAMEEDDQLSLSSKVNFNDLDSFVVW